MHTEDGRRLADSTVRIGWVAASGVTLWAASLWAGDLAAGESEAAARDFFEARIRPVLVERCYECHSGRVPFSRCERRVPKMLI
jgi:hypothetical protein